MFVLSVYMVGGIGVLLRVSPIATGVCVYYVRTGDCMGIMAKFGKTVAWAGIHRKSPKHFFVYLRSLGKSRIGSSTVTMASSA
jgi:hypothetical protein